MLDGIASDLRSPTPNAPLGEGDVSPSIAPLSAQLGLGLSEAIQAREMTATERWELEPPWEADDPDPTPTERHRRPF